MAVVLMVYCHSYDEGWLCWMLSHQLAACFLSCPVLRCIPFSFLLMKANSKSVSDLQFPFSCLKYPSHVWRRTPSSTGVLGAVCTIGIWNPILVFPSFAVCASFPCDTTAYDCYPGSSCNGCVWFCGKALHSPPFSIPTIWGSDGLSIGCKCWSIRQKLHAILRMSFQ